MVLLGGAVPLLGPLLGSAVVLFVPELPFAENPNFVQIAYGLALIVLILLLPQGLVSGLKALYLEARELLIQSVASLREQGRGPTSEHT